MMSEETRTLILDARTDIADAERCIALPHTSPSTETLLKRLRQVTDALEKSAAPFGFEFGVLQRVSDGAHVHSIGNRTDAERALRLPNRETLVHRTVGGMLLYGRWEPASD